MADAHELTTDELYPRCEEERFRLYIRRNDELEILASAADMGGIGLAIGTIHDDCKNAGMRRFDDLGVLGILDTLAHAPVITSGEWVVTPWERRS